jgi:hypothetical protein
MAGKAANHSGQPTMLAAFSFSTTIGMPACQVSIFPIQICFFVRLNAKSPLSIN